MRPAPEKEVAFQGFVKNGTSLDEVKKTSVLKRPFENERVTFFS